MGDNDTGVGQLAHGYADSAMLDEGHYLPPSWVFEEQHSSPTPSRFYASSGERPAGYSTPKVWRSAELESLFSALFPAGAIYCPSPDHWEMDLGDLLPLQVQRARSERSERGRTELGGVGD
jgi:hypothetical protein